ncbi:MAG TPA: DUF1028 domain-containing protein [Thermohalobaculum sp.]|nr:DUF1028 domain-containing protein [Thermohalobaculum sp.]
MTWSILAKDPKSGLYGLAVASRFFAVGALCPHSGGPHGAAMSQALPNPELGVRALMLLGHGHRAQSVVDMLVGMDPGIDQRQLHVIDSDGATAAHTGANCVDWCGHLTDDGISVAGNMLAGPQVIAETLAAYKANLRMPIVERLLTAMEAGEAAGGDKRGKQGAGLRIQGPECYARLDLRADDHTDPLAELRRLYAVARERFIPFSACLPTKARPYGIQDRGIIEKIIERDIGKPLVASVEIPEA